MRDSKVLELASPVAVVCHDAGAANIVLAWLQAEIREGDYRVVVEGPAASIWAGMQLPSHCRRSTLDDALRGAVNLLSGTGWASDLEYEARRRARALGIRSVAVLDHWVNYRERFVRRDDVLLPDELFVTDMYAYQSAVQLFPGVPVSLKPNMYLDGLVRQVVAGATAAQPEVLYALEPIRADWGRSPAGEFQALEYFLENAHKVGIGKDTVIRLRPHPSDAAGKYDAWLASRGDGRIVVAEDPSLAAAIGRATWVAGCETFALVVALAAGKKVVSCLPPWGHRCRLPHAGIIHLCEL